MNAAKKRHEGVEPPIGSTGAPLEIALSLIEEDPEQPRRNFDPLASEAYFSRSALPRSKRAVGGFV